MHGLGISISPELEAAIAEEARRHVEKVMGVAYALIPESVREAIEREYIQQRAKELQTSGGALAAQFGPAAIAVIGGLLVVMLLGRR